MDVSLKYPPREQHSSNNNDKKDRLFESIPHVNKRKSSGFSTEYFASFYLNKHSRVPPKQLCAGDVLSLIPGRLSFAVHSSRDMTESKIKEEPTKFYLSCDCQELYLPFCDDFGPVNLLVVHEFCDFMRKYWNHPSLQGRELIYYSEEAKNIRTNAAFLLGAFMVIELQYTPETAWAPFTQLAEDSFATFRDATHCAQDYHLTILACLQGLSKAIECRFYDPDTFDEEDYAQLEDPRTADMHVVCPKFIAFKGPMGTGRDHTGYTFTPKHYTRLLKEKGVSAVIRLNEPDTYDKADFTKSGINHFDLHFDDCTVPSTQIVEKFLDMCEKEPGMVAVHCRAGLGRTGTLIAIYLMKHFCFTASECIGWMRIVRPGSIIGPQQQYLQYAEKHFRVDPSKPGKRLPQPAPEYKAVAAGLRDLADSEVMGILVADAQRARAALCAQSDALAIECALKAENKDS